MVKESKTKRPGIQVIARAIAVLRALKDQPNGLSLGELAKLLSMPRATVQRIVDALGRENMVISATPTRGVRLGPGILALAAATRFDIAEIARPTLEEISRACGETVVLTLLDGDKLVLVDQRSGGHQLRAESTIGETLPLHATAPGKAILAGMGNDQLTQVKKKLTLTPFTAKTVVTWTELDKSLARIRKTGIAVDSQEHAIGISALAACFQLPNAEWASISIPVPTQRFAELQARLQKLLTSQVARLKLILGNDAC